LVYLAALDDWVSNTAMILPCFQHQVGVASDVSEINFDQGNPRPAKEGYTFGSALGDWDITQGLGDKNSLL
jgi:hypothetical protein